VTVKTRPFDAAEYLDDTASQVELLVDAIETNDRAYISHAINVVVRARRKGSTENLVNLTPPDEQGQE
jgi:DNA-binding phage protein